MGGSVATFINDMTKKTLMPWQGEHDSPLTNFVANSTPYAAYDQYKEQFVAPREAENAVNEAVAAKAQQDKIAEAQAAADLVAK